MLTQEQLEHYEQDGFLHIKQFLSPEQCEKLKSVAHRLIDEWEPETDYSWVLSQYGKNGRSKDQHLMDSHDQISFFIDKGAVDPETGKLIYDKHDSVSSIGHGLHLFEPEFQKIVFSDKAKTVLHDLKFRKPALRQTLYIFKQPRIGEPVSPHRDTMYFYTDPLVNIAGIWIALEDATVNNGCLWFIPGSHLQAPQQRYLRNPNEEEFNQGKGLIFVGEKDQYDDKTFVPAEVKAGDAVVIHGNVVHKSAQNTSSISRQIFCFHVYESDNDAVYSKGNWLQPTAPFPLVYDE